MKLYGIPNCNTVKKARTWLTENGMTIPFHDFKKQGVSEELLKAWLKQVGWEKLVNRQGSTWRQLPDETKAAVCDESSVIKRPVLETEGKITLGFDAATYQSLFGIK